MRTEATAPQSPPATDGDQTGITTETSNTIRICPKGGDMQRRPIGGDRRMAARLDSGPRPRRIDASKRSTLVRGWASELTEARGARGSGDPATGRDPVGNTGGANVSAFVPIPIPEYLRSALEDQPQEAVR